MLDCQIEVHLISYLKSIKKQLTFRLVSPSRFAVVTKHVPCWSAEDSRIKSQGNSSFVFTLTISPTCQIKQK